MVIALLVTIVFIGGMCLGAILNDTKQADNCANCQYNCETCSLKEKETK